MGQFAMKFHGICMHLNGDRVALPSPVLHRVVALDASQGFKSRKFGDLPQHFIRLLTDDDTAALLGQAGLPRDADGQFRLTGARMTISNAIDHPLEALIDPVPRLTDYAPGMALRSDLSGVTVPETGDCFVDMTHGSVEWDRFLEGGLYSTWTVETDGDPTLDIVLPAFDILLPVHERITVTLPFTPGTSLILKNGTTDGSDRKYDFALHYLAAVDGIDAQEYTRDLPHDAHADVAAGRYGVDTTTSCSNSQYP